MNGQQKVVVSEQLDGADQTLKQRTCLPQEEDWQGIKMQRTRIVLT